MNAVVNEIRKDGNNHHFILRSIKGTELHIESMSTGEKDTKTLSAWLEWQYVGK